MKRNLASNMWVFYSYCLNRTYSWKRCTITFIFSFIRRFNSKLSAMFSGYITTAEWWLFVYICEYNIVFQRDDLVWLNMYTIPFSEFINVYKRCEAAQIYFFMLFYIQVCINDAIYFSLFYSLSICI